MIVPESKDLPPMPMLWAKRRDGRHQGSAENRRGEIWGETMNEGRWIIVHRYDPNRGDDVRYALNLDHVTVVTDMGSCAWIDFADGKGMSVRESFDEIGAMIR